MEPLVSVVMNCYNGEKYLSEAVKSVVNQTYKNWELIFWDNLSKDNSKQELEKFDDKRIKYFLAENHVSQYAARNKAMFSTSGDFVAFLDVDDAWERNKLELQIKLFKDKEVGLVCSNAWILDERKSKKKYLAFKKMPINNYLSNLLKQNFVTMSSLVIRRDSYFKLPLGFDSQFEIIGDFDLVLRLVSKFKLELIDKPLTIYRWHSGNERYKIEKLSSELHTLMQNLKKDKLFIKNKNFKIFENNVYFNMGLATILKSHRLGVINYLKKMTSLKHKLKLIVVSFLPKKLILLIRGE